MALTRDRRRIGAKGLGKLEAREVSPSTGTNFDDLGPLDGTDIEDIHETEEVFDERGDLQDVLEKQHVVRFSSALLQNGIDELDFIKTASGKVHSLRYSGMMNPTRFQYYCFEQVRINPSLVRGFKPGKQPLPLKAIALKQDDSVFDTPEYYFYEGLAKIRTAFLQLWLDANRGLNAATAKLLDISGFARHGALSSDFATIWQTGSNPDRFLRFDGTNDEVNLGNVLNDDGSADFALECWVKITGADGGLEEILAKKSLVSNHTAGFALARDASNQILFKLSDGAASASVVSSATLLQNVWKHVMVFVDRNGNGQIYLNGAANGAAVSVASIGTGTNAGNLYLGRDGTNFGQVDIRGVRFYTFGAGALPTDAAAIALDHFNAEKAQMGL